MDKYKLKVRSISCHPDRSESTRGTSLSQRDSKLSHEIEAIGQPVQDCTQTLKSNSIQKEATRIVCVLLTSNAINLTQAYYLGFLIHFFFISGAGADS